MHRCDLLAQKNGKESSRLLSPWWDYPGSESQRAEATESPPWIYIVEQNFWHYLVTSNHVTSSARSLASLTHPRQPLQVSGARQDWRLPRELCITATICGPGSQRRAWLSSCVHLTAMYSTLWPAGTGSSASLRRPTATWSGQGGGGMHRAPPQPPWSSGHCSPGRARKAPHTTAKGGVHKAQDSSSLLTRALEGAWGPQAVLLSSGRSW